MGENKKTRTDANSKTKKTDFHMKREQLENVICGTLLRHPDAFLKHHIEPAWFDYRGDIIRGIQSLIGAGKDVDVFSLRDACGSELSFLVTLQKDCAGALGNLPLYLKDIQAIHKRSATRSMLLGALAAVDEDAEPEDILGGIISKSVDIHSDAKQASLGMEDAVKGFVDQFEEDYTNKREGKLGVKTFISGIDKALGGLHGTDLIIVGARPGVGKTAIGLSIGYNILRSGKRVAMFSIEMATKQIISRLASIDSGIPAHRLRNTELEGDEWSEFSNSLERLAGMDFIINDNPNISATEIVMQSRAWHARKPVDVILIDYLTKIRIDNSTSKHYLDVGNNVQAIKNLAKVLNVPIILLAQLNRNVAERSDKRPLITDLRDSGIIEQEADQILLLHRESMYDDSVPETEGEILIEKNRHGPCGWVKCNFDPDTIRWTGLS